MTKSQNYLLSYMYHTFMFITMAISSGCDNKIISEKEDEPNKAGSVSTKSVPVICVDLFVHWNGEMVYIGTACNSGGSSGGSGGTGSITGLHNPNDIIESPPYESGGTPNMGGSGGSGSTHYNPSTGQQEYIFKNLTHIYSLGSTLNLKQKALLEEKFQQFIGTPTNKAIFEYAVRNKVKIAFHYDPQIKAQAQYNASTKAITFQSFESLLTDYIAEEFVHAVQHQCFYGYSMVPTIKNYEFEVKVYFDLADIADGMPYPRFPTATDSRPVFANAYEEWILDIDLNKFGVFNDVPGFNRLCNIWQGYPGQHSPTFRPSFLEHFFRKATPPKPPQPEQP